MSISPVDFLARRIPDLFNWFVELHNHLGADNYYNGTWEPTITNLVPGYPVYADSITVNTGSISSGDIGDTQVDDDTYLIIAETTGNPGFSFDLTFSGVAIAECKFVLHGYYQGNAAHNVKLRIYNYNTTLWEDVTAATRDFATSATELLYMIDLPADLTDYNNAGEVKLRIIHTSNGAVGHFFRIDKTEIAVIGNDPTVSGFYQRFGKQCNFTIVVDGTHETEDSTVNLPISPLAEGVAVIHNATDHSFIGTATISGTLLYLPNYNVIDKKVIINGNYKVNGV